MSQALRAMCVACRTVFRLRPGMPVGSRLACPRCGGELAAPQAPSAAPPGGRASVAGSADDRQVSLAPPGEGAAVTLPLPDDGAAAVAEDPVVLLAEADAASPRYVQQGCIGIGGMGEVLLVVDRDTRRQIAMKRMLPEAAADPARRARFVEEAQVTAQLEHPNIVPVYELARQPDGSVYYTMKLVRGRSLADILRDQRDPKGQRGTRGAALPSLGGLLQVFLKVCDAVAFAHSRGVVHRDLKPANIMVGDYGEVLVMDWGLAKIIPHERAHAPGLTGQEPILPIVTDRQESTALQTLAGSMLGTPAYMSPEQAKGELDHIDARSDIWSLGAILYEILTLERTFEGETSFAILASVLKRNIVRPEQRAPSRNVPRELSAIAMKCLHRGRGHRYESVLDLKHDLTLYLEGRSVSAAPDTFSQALVKLIKRNRPVSAAIAAAAALLIAVTAFFLVSLTRQRNEALRARGVAEDRSLEAQAARDKQAKDALDASRVLAYQAIRAAEEGRFAEATARAESARTFLPDGPWGYYALGQIAMQRQDAAAARKQLDEALRRDPSHEPSRAALSRILAAPGAGDELKAIVARAEGAKDWRTLVSAGEALFSAGAPADALRAYERAVALMEKDPTVERKVLDEAKEEIPAIRDKAIDERGKALCVGFYDSIRKLSLEDQQRLIAAKFTEVHRTPITPEFGVDKGAIVGIAVNGQAVRSLEPLRGMPLMSVTFEESRVTDLGPLTGMPLTAVRFNNTRVSDLSPLKGMQLTWVGAWSSQVSDLSPLKGMPLDGLAITYTDVSDLGPLKGMPLKGLQCDHTPVSDLRPLAGMALEMIVFTPKNIKHGIEIVRAMKTMREIGDDYNRRLKPEEFWKKYDAGEFSK